MDAHIPHSWFFEENGQMCGPYPSQEILKFIMDGVLKVESKIYDADEDRWGIAADVIPYLNFEPEEILAEKSVASGSLSANWSPPPRPKEFKDVHVVDPNTETPAQIDYFMLINSILKTQNKPQEKAMFLNQSLQNPITGAPIKSLNDGSSFLDDFSMILSKFQKPITVAAVLSLVFFSAYKVVDTYNGDKGRIPATAEKEEKTAASEPVKSSEKQTIKMPTTSSLGTGSERVKRNSGGVSTSSHTSPAPSPNPENIRAEERAAPQFYSTSDEDRSVANAPDPNRPNGDPNNGAVVPPGYPTDLNNPTAMPQDPNDPNNAPAAFQ